MTCILNEYSLNIGNPGEFTIRQLAELIREKVNPGLELIEKPLPADDPLQRQPIIDLAQNELGWQPTISLENGLLPTIDWFRKVLEQQGAQSAGANS